jgi:cell division protein FtsL
MNELKRTSMIRRAMAAGQGRVVAAFALVAALFAAVGVFHAATHVSVVRAGYELGQADARYRELLHENEHLKLERATLRSAPRLEAIARARLGLVPPTAGQIVSIKGARPAARPAGEKVALAGAELPRNP